MGSYQPKNGKLDLPINKWSGPIDKQDTQTNKY